MTGYITNRVIRRTTATLSLILLISFQLFSCGNRTAATSFTFVHATDIHISEVDRGDEGTVQCINKINELAPEFVITGGDQVGDAQGTGYEEADAYYTLWEEHQKLFNMPVYNVMGNRDHFGFYSNTGVSADHPLYGKKMFMERVGEGKTYRSFDYKGWHFILLDSIQLPEEREDYECYIDEAQLEWLKQDLENTGKTTPVIVVTHAPLYTMRGQLFGNPWGSPGRGLSIGNANDVRALLEDNNVKLVLQGHVHMIEKMEYNGIKYITSGSVCGARWRGPSRKNPEGFGLIKVKGDEFEWEYVTFGWKANIER